MNKLDMLMNQLGMGAGLANQLKPSVNRGIAAVSPEFVAHLRAKAMTDPSGVMQDLTRMPRGDAGMALRAQIFNDPEVRAAIERGGSMAQKNAAYQEALGTVPPAMMGIDEDMGVLNELPQGIPGAGMPSVQSPNAVYDPKTGEYLGEYEFMPQNGLLYR